MLIKINYNVFQMLSEPSISEKFIKKKEKFISFGNILKEKKTYYENFLRKRKEFIEN